MISLSFTTLKCLNRQPSTASPSEALSDFHCVGLSSFLNEYHRQYTSPTIWHHMNVILNQTWTHLSLCMSLFNVHINCVQLSVCLNLCLKMIIFVIENNYICCCHVFPFSCSLFATKSATCHRDSATRLCICSRNIWSSLLSKYTNSHAMS